MLPSRITLLFAFVFISSLPALGAQRVALVIGNSNYEFAGSLPNPVNDANLMAVSLEQAGFRVTKILDANYRTMKQALVDFGRAVRQENEAGLVYYAGHGIRVKGENYLVPINAKIEGQDEVELEAINLNAFLRVMNSSKSGINIVILDACRNNPFARSVRSVGGGGGLAPVDAPKGTYIAYATSPGAVAADGEGANSPYTKALAQAISNPGLVLEKVFKQVRSKVLAATDDQQVPWEASSITGDFYFHQPIAPKTNSGKFVLGGKSGPASGLAAALNKVADERKREEDAQTMWGLISESLQVETLASFAKKHAGTKTANIALERMYRIKGAVANRTITPVGDRKYVEIASNGSWRTMHQDIDDGKACVTYATPLSEPDDKTRQILIRSTLLTTGKDRYLSFIVLLRDENISPKTIELVVDGKSFPLKKFRKWLLPVIILQGDDIVNAMKLGRVAKLEIEKHGGARFSDTYNLEGFSASMNAHVKACKQIVLR